MKKNFTLLLSIIIVLVATSCINQKEEAGNIADKPLFRDPVYDGAADPVLCWNEEAGKWFMYYTNRRATVSGEKGVSWVHGTKIGIAESSDGGATWTYRDTCDIHYRPQADNTYWAPDVIEYEGIYHMFLTYVPGIFSDWGHPRHILHMESHNGINWEFVSELDLASKKVLDATVMKLPEGGWRLWYNNERDKKSMYYADSPDLYSWTDIGKAKGIHRGEGAKVFRWKGHFWMVTDDWNGLAVYQSDDDLENWVRQQENILKDPGTGEDDMVKGGHCDVVVQGEHAYVFYFTHPGRRDEIPDTEVVEKQRSSIQVAELILKEGCITCERNNPVVINLGVPKAR